jgi:hypothetical protein
MSSEPFTAQDANNLIQIARSAPLQNMAAAEAVNALLTKFAAFANEWFSPPKPAAPIGPPDPIVDPLVPTRLGMIKAGIQVNPPATDEELFELGRTR